MELILGDCLDQLKKLKDNSIDAIVTDPPYGLSFMGKKWDYDVPSVDIWKECLRVLKPGGYLLSFAGTRTQHRMAVNIEDAGFEIRDMIAWVYGSGFPKSLNIGKAVDKLQGKEVKTTYVPNHKNDKYGKGMGGGVTDNTPSDNEYNGWGTALKPALEPITVARKPLEKGLNVAQNCLKWGVGGINIDGCRVEYKGESDKNSAIPQGRITTKDGKTGVGAVVGGVNNIELDKEKWIKEKQIGRFPANLIHDGSEEVRECFPETKSGTLKPYKQAVSNANVDYAVVGEFRDVNREGDSGSAARFFYCAKASKRERNMGCEGLEEKQTWASQEKRESNSFDVFESDGRPKTLNKNNHPTVKPIALMEYLVKLVSRERQVVLDPFMGSGTTGMACKKLNREFIGIEMMPEYMEIAKARIEGTKKEEQLSLV